MIISSIQPYKLCVMHKRVLLLLDLEGVNNVVGEPYSGLSKGTEQRGLARSVGADQRHLFPGMDGEVYVFQQGLLKRDGIVRLLFL